MDFHPTGHPAGPRPCSDDTAGLPPALRAALRWLRCPHCAAGLRPAPPRALRCRDGHSFDLARHGYVSLLAGTRPHRGDGAAMVAAREAFLAGGHYRPLRSTITALSAQHAPPGARLVTDLAGGTGHYLAPVLDALPGAHGLVVDVSTPALRRAARSHPRAGAIAADLRGRLPLASGATSVALSVFGPRPVAEIARLLEQDGILVVATARSGHLRELRSRFGTLEVDPDKSRRLREAFAEFEVIDDQPVDWRLALTPAEAVSLAAMGPSGHHLDVEQLRQAAAELPETTGVSAAMTVTVLRRPR